MSLLTVEQLATNLLLSEDMYTAMQGTVAAMPLNGLEGNSRESIVRVGVAYRDALRGFVFSARESAIKERLTYDQIVVILYPAMTGHASVKRTALQIVYDVAKERITASGGPQAVMTQLRIAQM